METQNIEYKVKWKDESGGQNGGQKAGLNNEDLAKLLGISLRTIEREVVVLKKKNLIKRIGYGFKGYWAIVVPVYCIIKNTAPNSPLVYEE